MLLILMTLSAWAVTQSMGACAQSLPIVDLSYERHQAAYYNVKTPLLLGQRRLCISPAF